MELTYQIMDAHTKNKKMTTLSQKSSSATKPNTSNTQNIWRTDAVIHDKAHEKEEIIRTQCGRICKKPERAHPVR